MAEAPPFGNTGKSLTHTGIRGTHSSLTAWFTGSARLTHGKQLTKGTQKALSKSEGLHTVPGTQLCLWTERSLISQVLVWPGKNCLCSHSNGLLTVPAGSPQSPSLLLLSYI